VPFFGVRKVREDFYGAMHTFPMVVVTFRVLHCAALCCILHTSAMSVAAAVGGQAPTSHTGRDDVSCRPERRAGQNGTTPMRRILRRRNIITVTATRLCQARDADLPHLMFHGPLGSGKKTRIMALLRTLFGPGVDVVSYDLRCCRRWSVAGFFLLQR